MEPRSWLTLEMEPNQLVSSGYTIKNTNQMAHLKNAKQGLWKKSMHKKKELTMKKHSHPQQNGI